MEENSTSTRPAALFFVDTGRAEFSTGDLISFSFF